MAHMQPSLMLFAIAAEILPAKIWQHDIVAYLNTGNQLHHFR